MPDLPAWIDRIDKIAESVTASGSPVFDRAAIEELFGVRRRRAILLMHRMRGYKAGKAMLVDRQALLNFLRDPLRQVFAGLEARRFSSVVETLGDAREALRLPRIPVPPPTRVQKLMMDGLPEGINLKADELRICFDHPQQLLERLLALSQALANDYDNFERAWTKANQP